MLIGYICCKILIKYPSSDFMCFVLFRRLESQRDEALQNFLEAQDTLEDFQKKTKERLKQVTYFVMDKFNVRSAKTLLLRLSDLAQ